MIYLDHIPIGKPPSTENPDVGHVFVFFDKNGNLNVKLNDGTIRTIPYAHNNLTALQGGTTNEYYHLTASEYSSIVNSGAALGETWEFDDATGDSDPGSKKFRLNNATQENATFMYISDTSESDVDASNFLLSLQAGNKIYFQESKDASRFHVAEVTDDPVDATTYVKIPINIVDSGSDIEDGEKCGIVLFFTGAQRARSNYKLVRAKSDFPDPSTGVITLADNTIYEINGTIALGTDRLVMGDNSMIIGKNVLQDKITYTGSGDMISSTSASFEIIGVELNATAGTLFNIASSSADIVRIERCRLIDILDLGVISSGLRVDIIGNHVEDINDGLDLSSTINDLNILDNLFDHTRYSSSGGVSMLKPTGTFMPANQVLIRGNKFQTAQTGDYCIDSNVAATHTDTLIIGNMFDLVSGANVFNNIDADNNPEFEVVNNFGLEDFEEIGVLLMESNTTDTTITTQNQWTKVAGTTVAGSTNSRFTMTGNNTLRYDGIRTKTFTVSLFVGATSTGNSIDDYEYTIFLNSTKITNLNLNDDYDENSDAAALGINISLAQNDVLEVYVRNTVDNEGTTVNNMQLVVKSK